MIASSGPSLRASAIWNPPQSDKGRKHIWCGTPTQLFSPSSRPIGPTALHRRVGAFPYEDGRKVSALRAGMRGVGTHRQKSGNKAVLLHMAQVWFRLAEEHAARAAETIEA